ncbi:hypothetical protein CV102_15645 [Natronococcus pandeyae]|uniref:Uncharacterized protein n=1 Tax=Natronococcus pandeyae TaxID=2055836 RepID=A0A8J8Q1M0_9EURY|nr:hypothetical protein [Natronococcus pandeyae]TYL37771.1 hypothetical protein CV102_15645 [Natronococcus pandeyae]
MITEDGVPRLAEPSPETEGWTVASRTDGRITLDSTDTGAVCVATTGGDLEDDTEDLEIHEARARMTVDTEEKPLSHGELRMNVSDRTFSGN